MISREKRTERKLRGIPLTLRPNVTVETGRASYGDVIHQLPRGGGVRECIVARTGWSHARDLYHATLLGWSIERYTADEANAEQVLCSTDFGALELTTHGQNCLWTVGYSELAKAINSGADLHCALAAKFLGLSIGEFMDGYEGKLGDAIKKRYKAVRQAVKPANFGFPGGMGAVKLVLQQRKQGPDTVCEDGKVYKGLRFCVLLGAKRCGVKKITEYKDRVYTPVCEACVKIAEDIRTKWFEAWPENKPYFEFVNDCVENGQKVRAAAGGWIRLKPGQVQQHKSKRVRGDVTFTSGANGFFQGLAGDGAKRALTRVSRECYDHTYRMPDGSRSPLWGCRIILFAHDELIVEGPRATAHLWAPRISVVMVESMREFTPDVAITAPCAIARRWYKSMEPAFLDPTTGKIWAKEKPGTVLVPWFPEIKYAKE